MNNSITMIILQLVHEKNGDHDCHSIALAGVVRSLNIRQLRLKDKYFTKTQLQSKKYLSRCPCSFWLRTTFSSHPLNILHSKIFVCFYSTNNKVNFNMDTPVYYCT